MNKTTHLTYDDIQAIIIYLVKGLHMPINAKQFVQVLSKELEIGSPQLLNGIIEVCLEQEYFYEFNEGVLYDEEALSHSIEPPNDFEIAIINYLPSFYKEACGYYEDYKIKRNLIYLSEYINTHYHGLLNKYPGKSFMERIWNNVYDDELSNQFWVEYNDYGKTSFSWWSKFFDDPKCMVKIKDIQFNIKRHSVNINVFLIPTKDGNTNKALKQYGEFKEHIGEYFNCNVTTHSTIMRIYKQRRKKHV